MYDPSQDFGEVYFALCKSVDTPHALACWLSWKEKCFTSLEGPCASAYCDAASFERDYLVYSWVSKAQVNLENRDLKKCALDSFNADEDFNLQTTSRIRSWDLRGSSPRVEALIHRVKRKIDAILGPFDLLEVMNRCRFGNGASATLSRRKARVDQKITTFPLSVSPAALGLARCVVESDLHWLRALMPKAEVLGPCSLLPCCFLVTDFNVFDTVPKSLKTDRTIAKEPTLNGFLQQGVHVILRERLQRAGVDLRDQRINQCWASLAENLGLATLDAKSASNSVTTALVALLLPYSWFNLLDLLRSRKTLLPDGTIHRNVMFSSMGNAFTFELESLIFYSILTEICEPGSIVSVYGDDMIVPQGNAEECIEMLELFGFRINQSKSFISGRFFESCGKHYWGSSDVTPVYQKKAPRFNRFECIAAHNRLIRWALRSGYGVCLNRVVSGPCELLKRGHQNFSGPIGSESDTYFQVPYGGYRVRNGHAQVKTWEAISTVIRTRQSGAYAYWLRLAAARPPSQEGRTVFPFTRVELRSHADPGDGLVFSETDVPFEHCERKRRISMFEIQVDVQWA